jgi:hypothetical protein
MSYHVMVAVGLMASGSCSWLVLVAVTVSDGEWAASAYLDRQPRSYPCLHVRSRPRVPAMQMAGGQE